MAKNGSKGKSHHSGAHGPARVAITLRNKARKAKKWAKIWGKRRAPARVFARIQLKLARRKKQSANPAAVAGE